ncbi:MAG: FAD-dependent oxidoreductase [Candidatus Pacebacteria bacterium]|nr:FAD-dependent oxidoreductase [Candidatus Paceibacterota bacterium]
MQNNKREFILIEKKKETDGITSLFFKTVDGLRYEYVSGQYVVVKKEPTGRGKSYTISSDPSLENICITVKRKGEMSSFLIDLNIGEKITFEGPYGSFYPKEEDMNIVMIAGGIGVTPFYSIIKNKIKLNFNKQILLLYSNKTVEKTPFFEGLNKLSENNSNFKIIYFLTGENTKNSLVNEYARISGETIKKYVKVLENKHYYVCGSIEFVNNIWKILKKIGIDESFIFTETFY